MITITVFKDELKYEADLVKNARKAGLNSSRNGKKVWTDAKEATSSICHVRKIRTGDPFNNLKPKEQNNIAYDIAHDVAAGRGFKMELT